MDYGRFLELRSPHWDRFERGLAVMSRKARGLDYDALEALALSYRQVLHDQALAAARFPGTAADRRLRRLALQGTRLLTRDAGGRRGSPSHFFLRTFPRTFRRHLGLLGIVTAAFLALTLLGLALAVYQPGLGVAFIGPKAVEGLAQGRLWTESLTTTIPPAVSSSGIATNNLSVGLTAWAGGALAGLLTLWILVVNGLMLGSIIGVTLHYSMAAKLLDFIAAHGPLELTLILVCCGAGLLLARGMAVADDRPRRVVLGEAAQESLVLLAGALPWFLVLGTVEALISPDPDLSTSFKTAVGLALEAIFLFVALNPLTREKPLA